MRGIMKADVHVRASRGRDVSAAGFVAVAVAGIGLALHLQVIGDGVHGRKIVVGSEAKRRFLCRLVAGGAFCPEADLKGRGYAVHRLPGRNRGTGVATTTGVFPRAPSTSHIRSKASECHAGAPDTG